ncbi:SGNH/GDSL hydrolase family protein [uncultured Limosilactobacillus sp.]|uniref:SGNH/GDSL hydrolase family protein n=1 Tax=uncultured Limosilactobacillus sp. TaxID=2837629 RepID=UPI0025E59AC0|nr:SGNH/GDSL hydrolase family protein [uncultured Limosilactobacillus sp.]
MTKRSRRNVILGLVIICLVLCGWLSWQYFHQQNTTKTSSSPTRVVKKTVHLVAIGDSLTYGQGDEKKQGGYVGIIKPRLQRKFHNQITTVNYGVSGDRSDQILGRINHQPAIQQNLKKADVIVMTVGGNDLMQSLQKDLTINSTQSLKKNLNQAGETYQRKLQRLFRVIRQQNHTAPIFVMSIYNPVYTYFPQADNINNAITKWNYLTKDILSGYEPAYFVDINHLMSYGQYKTKQQRQYLVKSSQQANSGQVSQKQLLTIMNERNKNLNQYISTDDNFHPNHLGYRQMTEQLFKVMVQHDSFEYKKR